MRNSSAARVVHISTAHPAFDVRIFHKECVSLAQAGFDVHLIVRAERCETVSGVTIHPIPPRRRRMARTILGTWSVLRIAWRLHADLYHIHDPELLPAALILKLTDKTVVYDSHEDFRAHILIKNWIVPGLRPLVSRVAGAVEKFAARRIDAIVATSGPIARPFPPEKTVLVRNFPRRSQVLEVSPVHGGARCRRIVYIGLISEGRCAREMVAAMALVPEELQIRLSLAGQIDPPALLDTLKQMPGWSRIDYAGQIPYREINALLGGAMGGIAICAPSVNYMNALSTKVFDYMAAAIPVISSDFPGWREAVNGYDCSIFIDGTNAAQIAAAIVSLAEKPQEARAMGARGQRGVIECINWETEFLALQKLYERLGVVPAAAEQDRQ
jgi:glycosyltransferase involved in cell wall biosynthesis